VWSLAALLLVAMFVFPFFYYPAEAEFLPPEADTTAIPIGGTVLATLIFIAPIVLGLTWFCLRDYRPAGFLVWRRDRPITSLAATLLLFALGLPLCWAIADDLLRLQTLPIHEHYSLPIPIIGVAWLIALRAALISKQTTAP